MTISPILETNIDLVLIGWVVVFLVLLVFLLMDPTDDS